MKSFKNLFKNRLMFIHIPKTGGTTLVKYLENKLGPMNIHHVIDSREITNGLNRKNKKLFVMGHFGFNYKKYLGENYKVFTYMRDPKERLLSLYYFWRNFKEEDDYEASILAKSRSLEDFLLSQESIVYEQINNGQFWQIHSDFRIGTRVKYKHCTEETLIKQVKSNIDSMAAVGITENFDYLLYNISSLLRIEPSNAEIKNKNLGKPKIVLSDREMEALVAVTHLDQIAYDYILEKSGVHPDP